MTTSIGYVHRSLNDCEKFDRNVKLELDSISNHNYRRPRIFKGGNCDSGSNGSIISDDDPFRFQCGLRNVCSRVSNRIRSFGLRFRMRMRVLSIPAACPDWRKKVRVGSSEEDELPDEWEMEQIALDKLDLKRQQSLAQRHAECIRLRKRLQEAEMADMTQSTTEFLRSFAGFDDNSNGNGIHLHPSPIFRRSTRSQSISMQNLALPDSIPIKPKIQKALSGDEMISLQRMKRLQELKNELEEFAAIHASETNLLNPPFASFYKPEGFRGSTLSLVSQDGIENSKEIPEISYMLQKRREKELKKARREVRVLEHKLKMGKSEEADY